MDSMTATMKELLDKATIQEANGNVQERDRLLEEAVKAEQLEKQQAVA